MTSFPPSKSFVADALPAPQLKLTWLLRFHGVIQLLVVSTHCARSVQVGAHHATAHEARPRRCRATVLQTDFQFFGSVQASRAYRNQDAIGLRPRYAPADLLRYMHVHRTHSLYQDSRAKSTDGRSIVDHDILLTRLRVSFGRSLEGSSRY